MEEEKLQKDIEAIENEKQKYLDGTLDEEDEEEEIEEEDVDVDVIEISLDEEEINEWIGKLEELRENKGEVDFELDEENELKINYERGDGEEDE